MNTFALPVMIIGDRKAAVKPFSAGFCFTSAYCVSTCWRTLASQFSAVTLVGRSKAGPRSCSGWSIEGSVAKNSTPAAKPVIDRPVFGSSRIGTSALRNTPSGPSSDRAKRMVSPPMPGSSNPPSMPKNSTRSATGVVMSKVPISRPCASSLIMPPIRPPDRRPPNSSPSTRTATAPRPTIGN